jgi:hypothetical protein
MLWWESNPLTSFLVRSLVVLDIYIGAQILVKVIILTTWLNRLFEWFDIAVRPLHPDRAGGLKPLGDFVVRCGYLIAVFGLGIAYTIIRMQFQMGQFGPSAWGGTPTLSLAIYTILAPICFFAPLGAAHVAMRDARDRLLLEISDEFGETYQQAKDTMRNQPASLKKRLTALEEIQKIYDIASKFPVWPFD